MLSADPATLRAAHGMGETTTAAIRIAHAAAIRLLRTRAKAAPVLSNWQALADYLHADMAHDGVERFRVLHLNTRNMLIRDEVMSEGSIDQAAVHVREVIRRAMDLGSAAIILVHNHPSGDPTPSRDDIQLTRAIADAAKPLGIAGVMGGASTEMSASTTEVLIEADPVVEQCVGTQMSSDTAWM